MKQLNQPKSIFKKINFINNKIKHSQKSSAMTEKHKIGIVIYSQIKYCLYSIYDC